MKTLAQLNEKQMNNYEIRDMIFNALKKSTGYRAILKAIPFSEENLIQVRKQIRKFFKNEKVTVRTRWRGVRSHHPDHNIKKEAIKFDVYVYTH
ncbi:MAG: hypothetical protein Unbinned202contig1000_30 [Prokaryotic dsDNA virus sp.]|nr:MAG: hypothetical protein Unbinned202contig1000_30 [Prokaryotic dsDNA virus sp.]